MSIQPITPAPDAGAVALPAIVGGDLPGLALLGQWVNAADAATRLAGPIVATAFVPDSFWPTPKNWPQGLSPKQYGPDETDASYETRKAIATAAAASAILLGMAVSIDPWTSLANIHVVKNRPGMSSKLKVALARAAGHRIVEVERSAEAVTVEGQRKGGSDIVRIRITIQDAERAGWTKNDTYTKTPEDMLYARAASRVVDRVCPEVVFGMASIEDLADVDEPAAEAARVTMADVRGTAPDPAAAEAVAAVFPARAPVAEPPALIDERTSSALNAEFVRLGVTGPGVKERRRRAVARIIERPEIASARELTQVEGDLVLDVLQGLKRGQPALHNLLAEDGEPLQAAGQGATLAQTTGEPQAGEQVGTFLPPRPGDVDLGDADPDGDLDVPEPDDAERASAPVVGDEPEGWR